MMMMRPSWYAAAANPLLRTLPLVVYGWMGLPVARHVLAPRTRCVRNWLRRSERARALKPLSQPPVRSCRQHAPPTDPLHPFVQVCRFFFLHVGPVAAPWG